MKAKYTFRHMDHSDVIEEYTEGQMDKVYDFLSHEKDPILIEIIYEPSKVHAHHKVELRIKSPQYNLTAHREGPEFYDVIDHVVDIMYRNLHEAKRRAVDERKQRGRHDEFKKQR